MRAAQGPYVIGAFVNWSWHQTCPSCADHDQGSGVMGHRWSVGSREREGVRWDVEVGHTGPTIAREKKVSRSVVPTSGKGGSERGSDDKKEEKKIR